MYRDLGNNGLLLAMRTGPYTGPPRTFSQHALPPHLLVRLRGVLDGSARPSPILKCELRDPGRQRWLRLGLAGLTALALGGLASAGFAQAHHPFQSALLIPLYSIGSAVIAALLWKIWSEHQSLLQPRGIYLLPLDVLEISASTVTISPLGSVRQATIEGDQGAPALVLAFEHGARHVFPVTSEHDAEQAYEALSLSQDHLETLTRSTDIERACDLDPFFTLRGTGHQGQDTRAWSLPSRDPSRGVAAVFVAGLLVGAGLWKLRNEASDQESYERAFRANTIESYEAYLSAGQRNREIATKRLQEHRALATLREENERINNDEELRKKRERAAAALEAETERATCEPVVLPGSSPEQAAACYQRRATREHPEVARWIEARITARKNLRVALKHQAPRSMAAHLEEREEQLLGALRKIFAEVAPVSVLTLERTEDGADLVISTRVTPGASPLGAVHVFDVALRSPNPTTFTLTMPAAKKMPELRARSIYTVRDTGEREAPSREVQLMSARAYDRLYDEVYSLFFSGPPRVPLQASPPAASSIR